MIDIQIIRENPEMVAQNAKNKGYSVDIKKIVTLDASRRILLKTVEELRARRNTISDLMKGGKPDQQLVDEGKRIKVTLTEQEALLAEIENELTALLKTVPNISLPEVPIGNSEDENVVFKTIGEPTKFDFAPKTHWEIAEKRDLIDKDRASKISGSRFAYIKGDLVLLQFAIMQFVMDILTDVGILKNLIEQNNLQLEAKPFTPVLPPAMLRTEPYVASARLDAANVTYRLADDDLWLNASAEHTLCTMYWNETLPESMFPIRYIGYSTSFRREAGTYGKDTEGIIRMHQFDKLEMEVLSTAETGEDEHKLMVAIQEYLVQQLGVPYRVLKKCTFDIGKPNASGYDVECWFPGQDRFIETHTADFMTDYQSRDLKIKVKRESGETELVHTNDATAFALGRIMAAILENYQTEKGTITVPMVLQRYLGNKTEI
jgi:seryl-tRNA synthetase